MTMTLTEPVARREPTAATETTTFFHLSLLVADLDKSFGVLPRALQRRADEGLRQRLCRVRGGRPAPLARPDAVRGRTPGGALNHVGLRFTHQAAVESVEERLKAAGMTTRHEESVACCYARQTKCWATDPDHNLWEIYVLFQDLDYNGYGGRAAPPLPPEAAPGNVWEYKLGDPAPIPRSSPITRLMKRR